MKSSWFHASATGILHAALIVMMILLLPGACSSGFTAPPVTRQLAEISRFPTSLLERGYIVHQAKCAKCHPYENPANHEIKNLTRTIMPAMARKAKLDPADEQAVLAYLLAARQVPPQGPPGAPHEPSE